MKLSAYAGLHHGSPQLGLARVAHLNAQVGNSRLGCLAASAARFARGTLRPGDDRKMSHRLKQKAPAASQTAKSRGRAALLPQFPARDRPAAAVPRRWAPVFPGAGRTSRRRGSRASPRAILRERAQTEAEAAAP